MINDQFIDDLKMYYLTFIWIKWDKVQNSWKKKRIIKIDLEQLMNQLIVRVMNHKKNRLKSNSKIFKNETNTDSKSDAKNNLNSNSNSNFKKSKPDKDNKKKRKSWVSFDNIKVCSYCHKRDHEESYCRMKNWKTQSDKWKKFHESEIQYWKKINKIKNKAKNKIKKMMK